METYEKAGDVIYNSILCSDLSRGELINTLFDICRKFFPLTNEDKRFSNGVAIDTILMLLDVAVVWKDVPEFKRFVQEYEKDISQQSAAVD